MLKKYKDVLSIPLNFWKYTGASPILLGRKRIILEVMTLTLITVLAIWEYLLHRHDFKVITDTLHSINTILHIGIFCFMNLFKCEKLLMILENVNQFWDYEDPDFDDDFKTDLSQAMQKLKRFLKIYRGYAIIAIFSFFMASYLSSKFMMLPCHVPEFFNYYVFISIPNIAYVEGAVVLIGTDMFVLSNLFLLVIQFKILGQKLLLIDYSKVQSKEDEINCLEKLKTYINHHNFLLKCADDLNNVYSISLLVYFINVVMSMCLLLYVGLEKESGVASMVQSGAYMLGITVELSIIYCLPAEYLTGEASNIAGYIYNSNWGECRYTSIKKELMVMIMRAQKETLISAGKMMPVNLATCTQLFKSTLSFYTFLNNIRG